jgi:hypothetical protein
MFIVLALLNRVLVIIIIIILLNNHYHYHYHHQVRKEDVSHVKNKNILTN